MKISKLFHWLYAILMFLPIFGIAVKCAYVVFNDNALESYRGTYKFNERVTERLNLSEYQGNTVGNYIVYTQTNNTTYNYALSYTKNTDAIYTLNTKIYIPLIVQDTDLFTISDYQDTNYYYLTILFTGSNTYAKTVTVTLADNNKNDIVTTAVKYFNYSSEDFSFYVNGVSRAQNVLIQNIEGNPYNYNIWKQMNVIYDSYIIDNTLSSVFFSSLQELDNSEFFGWAKNSFLVAPISYIGNLFGITNPHPIFTLMSYWLSISIIWLVFDLIMYIPLLVHRWLDKGVIE